MLSIQRISHATFETPDLDRQVDYHVGILGLAVADRTRDEAFLKTSTGQLAVRLRRGNTARCAAIAFQVDPEHPLADAERALAVGGIRAKRRHDIAPGLSHVLAFDDPKGTAIEVFAEQNFLDEDRTPKGFTPLKLGHLAFKVLDIQQIVGFYRDVLGFRVSDWREDFFVFMRCGPDHHTVNFATAEKVKMHHIAFELKDMAEMMRACDFLGRNDLSSVVGARAARDRRQCVHLSPRP